MNFKSFGEFEKLMADEESPSLQKGLKEAFAQFFEQPSRESLRSLLQNHTGEQDELDFKEDLPEKSSLARHILAIANSGGGCIVIGMSERSRSLEAVGVKDTKDKADTNKGVAKYLPNPVSFGIHDFPFEESEYPRLKGKRFQVIIIESNVRHLPYVSQAAGSDIQEGIIYVRRGTNSTPGNHYEVEELIQKRLSSYSSSEEIDLEKHLSELERLYDRIEGIKHRSIIEEQLQETVRLLVRNPRYPQESFEEFVAKVIDMKKRQIEEMMQGKEQV